MHVSPYQDDVININLNPRCPLEFNQTMINLIGHNCTTNPNGTKSVYNFEIPKNHYPGSHWVSVGNKKPPHIRLNTLAKTEETDFATQTKPCNCYTKRLSINVYNV